MIAGQLEIQLMANMARLVSDMDRAKRTVGDTVDTMNRVLGTIGVGLSFAGIASLVKGVADVGDKLNDLRKITGLTVNELGGLDKMAKLNGTDLDSVAKGIGNLAKNMSAGNEVFKLIGVSIRDTNGNLRNANQVLLDVAEKFARYEDGAAKSALANELFGKAGRDLIPLLSEGRTKLEEAAEAHRKYSGWTNESAELADKFNDEMTILQGRIAGVKNRFVIDLLPTLTDITGAFSSATEKANGFSLSGNILSPILKGLAHAGYLVFDVFNGIARSIGGALAQAAALATFDYQKYVDIGQHVDELNEQSRASYDAFVDSLYNGDKALQDAAASQSALNDQQKIQPPTLEKITSAQKETITEAQRFIEALQKEARETGLTGTALTRLRAQYLGVSDAAGIYIDEIERKNRAQRIEEMATQDIVKGLERYKKLNEDTKTALEKYQDQVKYINEARNATDGTAISQETYNRALQKAQEEFDKTRDTGKSAMNDLDQYAIQAARNIQTSLANFLFDPFQDGLKGMVTGVLNAVRRMVAEFAALKIAQSLGLQQIFGGLAGIGTGTASSGAASGGSNLLSVAGMGSNLVSMFRGGFGATSLVGGALSMLPGNIGAFGSGLAGDALGGLISGGFTSSAASAASMGASMAAFAGPAIALAGVDIVGRMLAGDKKLGGAEMIPVIGGFLAAMFGRGPYKFRQQSLQGTVSSDGFDGDITNVFRSKGGWFMGNKHKSVTEQLTPEMQALFDSTIGGFFQAAHNASINLGLDAALVDNFSKEIQIKSEKGQKLTEQAITDMLNGISDDIAKAALPVVDQFKKVGETSIQTLSRLSNEFSVLTNAASLLFNKSAEWSKGFISSFGFGDRTAFLDKAGGSDAFAAMVSGFAQNFLSDDQRMRPVIEALVSQRDTLGLGGINTRDQYVSAVQSGSMNQNQLLFLLKNQDAIKNVFDYLDKKNQETTAMQNQALDFSNVYGGVVANFNKQVQAVTDNIEKLKDFSNELAGTVQQLQPMSRNEALQKLFGYATAARKGADLPDIATLRTPLNTLTSMNVNDYASQLDYARARAQSVNAVSTLIAISGDKQEKLAAQIVAMKEAFADSLANIAKYTGQTAQILDSTTAGGGPMLTQQA